jgi:hypothetical protein
MGPRGQDTSTESSWPQMALTEPEIKALKPADKARGVSDERGLHLEVGTSGAQLWRFK